MLTYNVCKKCADFFLPQLIPENPEETHPGRLRARQNMVNALLDAFKECWQKNKVANCPVNSSRSGSSSIAKIDGDVPKYCPVSNLHTSKNKKF